MQEHKNKPTLKLDWATHEAAKYACENWHYSKCLPVGKLVKIGVWENDVFKGVIIYSRGANKSLMSQINLNQDEGCELTRVALTNHYHQVSKMLAISFKLLLKSNTKLKAIISFADKEQNHHGGIYQASNWLYMGATSPADEYIYKGKRWHGRAFRKSHGSHLNYIHKGLKIIKGSSKHRYLMPLKNRCIYAKFLSNSYPKRVEHESNAPSYQEGESGVIPTGTLHNNMLQSKQETLSRS